MRSPTDDLIIKKVKEAMQEDRDDAFPRTILGIAQDEVASDLGLSLDRVKRAWDAREEGVPTPTTN